jgi:predicted metalloprotease with PDZ domain
MVRDMPKGNPQPGDQGLDNTHTWGRTYWGGAQFCLLADVTIREQTHNRKGLQDALRAIVVAGGAIDQNWPIRKALQAGDAGTGSHVLEEQYDRMANAPVAIDLDGLWKKLGIIRTETGVRFDDSAPEAAIRAAITATPATGRIAPAP